MTIWSQRAPALSGMMSSMRRQMLNPRVAWELDRGTGFQSGFSASGEHWHFQADRTTRPPSTA
ncbi:MAG: hypothetical protein NTW19_04105 [Planctomycetota bacterium]|nr:hypothetical protein [Planctomycetota bacterium]